MVQHWGLGGFIGVVLDKVAPPYAYFTIDSDILKFSTPDGTVSCRSLTITYSHNYKCIKEYPGQSIIITMGHPCLA
jgi:hypothetical protein